MAVTTVGAPIVRTPSGSTSLESRFARWFSISSTLEASNVRSDGGIIDDNILTAHRDSDKDERLSSDVLSD